MISIRIQLEERQVSALRRLAAEQGVPVAALIRQAVDAQLRSQARGPVARHLDRLKARLERFDGNLTDLGEAHDRYLQETFAADGDVR